MTLVGKIFTMLILVMSIMFMAFAMMVFVTHRDWRKFADNASPKAGEQLGLKQQLAAANTALADAKLQRERLQNELAMEQAARKHALAALQVRAAKAEDELNKVQGEYDKLLAQNAQASEAAKAAQERLVALEGEAKTLRDQLRTVSKDLDTKFNKVVELTDSLNQALGQELALKEINLQATQQIARQKNVMILNGLTETTPTDHIAPDVDGVILEVSDKDLVEISIGKDDGLKVGHSLDIYRGNAYLGKIVIKKTGPDRAVGQLQKELQRGQIKQGDYVTTKFRS